MPEKEKTARNQKIIKAWKAGMGYRKLAKAYSLHYTTIANIITREIARGKLRSR